MESEARSEELLEEIRHRSTTSISAESQIYPSATLREDVGGLAMEHRLREEHEGYPGSLMSMERYDPEIQEDVHRSQGPPFTRGVETLGTHVYMGIPEPGEVMRTLPFVFQDWLTFM
jgi:hypothetical protein